MASFYSSEGDMLPTAYLLNQKLSYASSELPNNKDYVSQPSVSLSYPNLLSTAQDHVEAESHGNRDEMMFIPPTSYADGNPVISDSNMFSRESIHVHGSEPIQQYHGLSLSLGSQVVPSLVQLPSDLNQYTNQNFSSLLGSNMQSEIQLPQNVKNVQYLSFDLAGKAPDAVKYGAPNNFQMGSKESGFMPSVYQAPELSGTVGNSKYLKAAQDLLDEVVNVHKAVLKQSEKGGSHCQDGSTGSDVKKEGTSGEPNEPSTNASNDLSPSERHDLQNKMTKLFSMLEEVDRRYKQYFHQMQVVVSSFDMVAGRGAARPYTALALRTISRQFRSLRDAIKKQIQNIQKSLGEQDSNSPGHGILSRLRHVDQQLRQQKALQQFGIMRQPWRPQRGLPESAVSVLRAWLFEHFLHPYPKDSEKLVLARQTGLTRSQVANWFINARVRLWKPMIEEMYKEEFGDPETEPKSSPEHVTGTGETSAFDDRDEEFQGSLMSAATERNHSKHPNELRHDNKDIDACRPELSYEHGGFHDNELNFGLSHLHDKQMLNDAHNNLITDPAMGNQVSLALGLQQSERDSQPVNEASTSSTGLEKMEYYYVDPVNNQHRFANPHLLSDFVA